MSRHLSKLLLHILLLTIATESFGLQLEPASRVLRVDGAIYQPRIAPDNSKLVYTAKDGKGLWLLDLKSHQQTKLTDHRTNGAMLWAPDSSRVFYRELYLDQNSKLHSALQAYDCHLKETILILTVPGATSDLSFDPRDNRIHTMSETGIKSVRLNYPMQRLARWQLATKGQFGYWLVTANQVFWVSNRGISMHEVGNGQGEITSYALSPFGAHIAWSQSDGYVYASKHGEEFVTVDKGRDVSWHPDGKHIIFAKANYIGKTLVDHDLAIIDSKGRSRVLQVTPGIDERFPLWLERAASILYTHHDSTDLFELRVKL